MEVAAHLVDTFLHDRYLFPLCMLLFFLDLCAIRNGVFTFCNNDSYMYIPGRRCWNINILSFL
jgi:hypothetical protein